MVPLPVGETLLVAASDAEWSRWCDAIDASPLSASEVLAAADLPTLYLRLEGGELEAVARALGVDEPIVASTGPAGVGCCRLGDGFARALGEVADRRGGRWLYEAAVGWMHRREQLAGFVAFIARAGAQGRRVVALAV